LVVEDDDVAAVEVLDCAADGDVFPAEGSEVANLPAVFFVADDAEVAGFIRDVGTAEVKEACASGYGDDVIDVGGETSVGARVEGVVSRRACKVACVGCGRRQDGRQYEESRKTHLTPLDLCV
jgi:hypothetical protein